MDLKDKLVSSFLAFENRVDVTTKVHEIRSEAIKTFEDKGFPSKKDEAWKYTSLNKILKHDYSVFPKEVNALEYKDIPNMLKGMLKPSILIYLIRTLIYLKKDPKEPEDIMDKSIDDGSRKKQK